MSDDEVVGEIASLSVSDSSVVSEIASLDSSDDEVVSKIAGLSVFDSNDAVIPVCSWNIMGDSNRSQERMGTTYEAFQSNNSLGQADIICIQEMSFHPESWDRKRKDLYAKNYLPFVDNYGVEPSSERGGGAPYNAVFYKKEKFKLVSDVKIQATCRLMDIKRKVYIELSKLGAEMKRKARSGTLEPERLLKSWGEIEVCEEVLDEVKGKDVNRAIASAKEKYIAPKEGKSKPPEELLRRRMAICCLEVRSLPGYTITAISLHNYSKSSGRDAPELHAELLFEFLDKIEGPVVIAGDFNLDISGRRLSSSTYCIEGKYTLQPLREDLRRDNRIDFILIKKGVSQSFETSLCKTKAHDFTTIPPGVKKAKIANHNPLSAEVSVKKCVLARPVP